MSKKPLSNTYRDILRWTFLPRNLERRWSTVVFVLSSFCCFSYFLLFLQGFKYGRKNKKCRTRCPDSVLWWKCTSENDNRNDIIIWTPFVKLGLFKCVWKRLSGVISCSISLVSKCSNYIEYHDPPLFSLGEEGSTDTRHGLQGTFLIPVVDKTLKSARDCSLLLRYLWTQNGITLLIKLDWSFRPLSEKSWKYIIKAKEHHNRHLVFRCLVLS